MDKHQFVYLNGGVALGPESHLALFRNLAEQMNLSPQHRALVRSTWTSGLRLEPGLPFTVARGHMLPSGHADIWESNVDRNHVRDTVEGAHGKLQADAWKPAETPT